MFSFTYAPLLWGLFGASIPIAIHLINMLRHRRVEWAAMEFLLVSQKKHRIWVLFKQLLLLLLRMAAIAMVVLMVSHPRWQSEFGRLLGTSKTHHIILLDDSFSMSDRWEEKSAFGEAKRAIEQIAEQATRQRQPQLFTLLRFSQVKQRDRGTRDDMLKEPVNRTEFPGRLEKLLGGIEVSETTAGAIPALEAIDQLMGESENERRIVYVISDFRSREWDNPTELRNHLVKLNQAEAEVHLVNCVRRARPNLAIASLGPGKGVRAAGVPLFMEVTVKNFGATPAKNVSVLLEEDGHTRPAVTIAEIPPGQEVAERFQVRFPTAGQHLATARLEEDAVITDNFRYSTVDLPPDVPVLIIDGSPDALGGKFLAMASAPGGSVHTGISPQIETPRFLSRSREMLDRFGAINLLNIDRLDESAVRALERYVGAGGGVVFFLGENTYSKFINDSLYRSGKGLFPLPVYEPAELLVDRLNKAPDVEVEKHFVFRVFADQRNSFLDMVNIEHYFAVPDTWQPGADSRVKVIARLRNGAPLVVERPFGKGEGKVLVFLTTAAPLWNNWARNPSFVVAMQDLQAYLSERPAAGVSQQVGSKLEVQFAGNEYHRQVRFVTPADDRGASALTDASPAEDGMLSATLPKTDTKGFHKVRLTRKADGATEVRHFAVNVDAEEGNLRALSRSQLQNRLKDVKYEYQQTADFQYTISETAGRDMADALLYLLILALIGEQILAWSASYHPPARAAMAAAKGGVR